MDLETEKQQAAEYAMALDLLAKIAEFDTEGETVDNIHGVFRVLFAPGKLSYLSLKDALFQQTCSSSLSEADVAEIQNLVSDCNQKYSWTASDKGFMVKISHHGDLLGIMVVDDIAYPEHKKRYLNLSLSIAAVCGLAIENSWRFQQLKNSEDCLRKENEKVEEALAKVKKLSGLLPICSFCKKIRDDQGYWKQIEAYIHEHSEVQFSHGVCKECAKIHYPGFDLYKDE